MNLIIKLEILILFQKTISQYVPIKYYHHPRQYTQAAYYLPFHSEEYSWTKSDASNTRKPHRKRKKNNDYYFSAEMDYGPKRLQCKCTCKRNYDTKPIQDYEQNDPCCHCDRNPDPANGIYTPNQYSDTIDNGIYTPSQYPDMINSGIYTQSQYPDMINTGIYTPSQYPDMINRIYTPTQFPYTFDNEIYTRTPYASMIYPTFDLSDIGKAFPWLTWGMSTTTKAEHKITVDKEEDRNKPSTKDELDGHSTVKYDKEEDVTKFKKEETTTTNDINRNITIEDRESSIKKEDKDETTPISDRDRPVTIDDRDRSDKKDDKDQTTTKDGIDRNSKEEKNKINPQDKSVESTTTEPKHSTIESTISTVPYIVSENIVKLHHYLPKKKQCLRNNCLRKDTVRKIGRYYEEDLFERPTVASYLNGIWRRNNIPRFR